MDERLRFVARLLDGEKIAAPIGRYGSSLHSRFRSSRWLGVGEEGAPRQCTSVSLLIVCSKYASTGKVKFQQHTEKESRQPCYSLGCVGLVTPVPRAAKTSASIRQQSPPPFPNQSKSIPRA